MLRELKVLMAKGETIAEFIKLLRIRDATYYKFPKQQRNFKVDKQKGAWTLNLKISAKERAKKN